MTIEQVGQRVLYAIVHFAVFSLKIVDLRRIQWVTSVRYING